VRTYAFALKRHTIEMTGVRNTAESGMQVILDELLAAADNRNNSD
jgi:hypothetical protein